ncbi:MAG: DUF4097 domain-containing protein [Deltaproteobacteria bacterium]|nr:DUF4097 domain-containing protein [Deltaproteobacteria bacterium]
MRCRFITMVLLVFAAGCSQSGGSTIIHKVKERRSFPRGASLSVTNTNGRLSVTGLKNSNALELKHEKRSTAKTYVEAADLRDTSKLAVNVADKAVTLEVKDPVLGPGQSLEHNIDLTIPEETPVEIRQANGPVSIKHIHGDISIDSSNGRIVVDDVGGMVKVHSSNGSIAVTGLSGGVSLDLSNGSVKVDVEKLACPKEGCRIKTLNGSVKVALPADAGVHIDAKTRNGGVQSELALENMHKGPGSLSGDLSGGGNSFKIEVQNGKIKLVKRYTE